MERTLRRAAVLAAAAFLADNSAALAHGFAGDRFFPATILTDDPFVADEMSLPTFTRPPPRRRRHAANSISISIFRSA